MSHPDNQRYMGDSRTYAGYLITPPTGRTNWSVTVVACSRRRKEPNPESPTQEGLLEATAQS